MRAAWALMAALALGAPVASCGGHHERGRGRPLAPRTAVDVYASLPRHGAWAAQGTAVAHGIELALAQAHRRAGRWRVHLIMLDDSSPGGQVFDPVVTAHNARAASTDPIAVYYAGELGSGASQISAPILNQAGIAQVSALSTALSLGPGPLDPSGRPTFLRLAPSDAVQAGAQLRELARARCRRVALIHDGTLEGTAVAAALQAEKGRDGVTIGREAPLPGTAASIGSLAARMKAQANDCLVFAGVNAPGAVALFAAASAANPRLRLMLGSDGVCTAAFTAALPGGARARFRCTSPAIDLEATAAGRAFRAAFRSAYGVSMPDPLAVYGYESMKLALDTIASLGPRGDNKTAVRDALFAIRSRHSVLGVYGFDRFGDSTLRSYGLWGVGTGGEPVFVGVLRP